LGNIARVHLREDDPVGWTAARLRALGVPSAIVARHVAALRRPRPPPRHFHWSEREGRWRRQLAARPLLSPAGEPITLKHPVRRPPKRRSARKHTGGTVKRVKLPADCD